ncbi:MBL fold metallo-hydrolase [Ammoniphilus sp. CFH 90114]|uniref:MBL fold metallo-hydrolase n=1 Tax=Ammoniphilus sp. CFH 90114 TaxID=2493665 RepID=UPI00100FC454|nr:MBL fold metallo-hydrolase [Ammoniphilus sp. CFH 90114]RXT07926.1 MBL fold metallo-hydrolase [Ammoniphilus sp. CFH 90114]
MTTAVRTELHPMTPGELTKIVLNKEELFILDVREQSQFDDWKIEGESIEMINIPYFDLLDGVDPALDKIPNGKKVLVVCAKEGSSVYIGEQIAEKGRSNVHYLTGGMKGWSEHLEPVKVGNLQSGGELYQFVRIGKGCLSYMIISNGEAAVVDTLRMADEFEQFANQHQVKIKHTIDTHLHADHISGGRPLAEKTGATYWLPSKDAGEVTFAYEPLVDSKPIEVGNVSIMPVYSPGHTIGSTSLIVDDQYLLSGDILFIESIGRPDLAGLAEDWVGDLRETLYQRYKGLAEDLTVLPAHFGKITELGNGGLVAGKLGDLYRNNPGLNIHNETEFRKVVTENLPPQPNAYQEIRQTNMGKIQPSEDERQEMEIGPNRCAVHDK